MPNPAAVMQTGPYMAAVSLLDTYMLSHGDFTCKRSLKLKGKELHLLSSVLDLYGAPNVFLLFRVVICI